MPPDSLPDPEARSGARQPIVLATINARHAHASLGLRYLKANAGALRERIAIVELVIAGDVDAMAARILARLAPRGPRIVGFGVYIWNVGKTTALVSRIRALAPEVVLVGGGPELSHELDRQPLGSMLDYVIQGPGDLAFARLAKAVLDGPRPLARVIAGDQPADLGALVLPYALYDAHDIAHRHLYVEASRGCPFKCEFCLSALDRTAWPFPLDPFVDALRALHARGARRFRFVDRTFNLRAATGERVLRFFLDANRAAPHDPCFAHFELVPDHLPDALRTLIAAFAPGTLQFEIGIQTLDPAVQRAIGRRQDDVKALANIAWLRARTHAHLHVDLIAGLPGESMASFGRGFDRLCALDPHEIQIGVLKRLRGAPIVRHESAGTLHFDAAPPYRVLRTDAMTAHELDEIVELARFHDRVVNSGRMPRLADALLRRPAPQDAGPGAGAPHSPFERLRRLAAALTARFGRSHAIAFEALVDATADFLVLHGVASRADADAMAANDYAASGAHGRIASMRQGIGARGAPIDGSPAPRAGTPAAAALASAASAASAAAAPATPASPAAPATPVRQRRHLHRA
ncbi:MAG: radical SAM protein [Lautropia sp.]